MAIAKRGKTFHIRFRPFRDEVIGLKTAARSKTEAKHLEMAILTACRSGDYRALDPLSREVCVRMFRNQGWEIPPDLGPEEQVKEELTLKKSMELFLKYPEIRNSAESERYEQCLLHLADHFGTDRPVKSLWVPEIKEYMANRLGAGAAPSTVNREKGTLSRLFQVLVELRCVDVNPVRLVKNLSQKSEERQVYLSQADVQLIADHCPKWFCPIIWTAYFTGMRRGEIFGLTRRQVNLTSRIITLFPISGPNGAHTKEGHWKRVPINHRLVKILEDALKVRFIGTDRLFLLKDGPSIRPLELETVKNPWPRACEALEEKKLLQKPLPRFHDLRHTWKTNARRSGVDPEIREAILGHAERGKSVTERYGRISDRELLKAIDRMTFDHGETEIFAGSWKKDGENQNTCTKRVQRDAYKENQDAACQA
jgi:integrase